jgi:hypothetical protein
MRLTLFGGRRKGGMEQSGRTGGAQMNKGLQPLSCKPLKVLVGTVGFELTTPCTP